MKIYLVWTFHSNPDVCTSRKKAQESLRSTTEFVRNSSLIDDSVIEKFWIDERDVVELIEEMRAEIISLENRLEREEW